MRVIDEVHGFVMNGLSIGGISTIGTTQDHVDSRDSEHDGLDGPSDLSDAGQRVKFAIQTTDVQQLIPLLISAAGTGVFYGRESGAATYGKGGLVGCVPYAGRFSSQRGGYATINIDGQCAFPNAAATFKDVETFVVGEAKPTLTHPQREWQPKNCAHGELSPLHLRSLSLTVPGRLLEDYGDDDIGTTAVDRNGFGLITGELTVRDSSKQAGGSYDMATALMENGVHDLSAEFDGVGDTAGKTLTLRNCKLRSKRKQTGSQYTDHTLSFALQWRDPTGGVIRTLDAGVAADRLIDWA